MDVEPLIIDEQLKPDESLTTYITVNNNGNGPLNFYITKELIAKGDKDENPSTDEYSNCNGSDLLVANPSSLPIYRETEENIKPDEGVTTEFRAEGSKDEVIIHYDGDNYAAIGLQDGGTFTTAARFTPEELAGYYGTYDLTGVQVFIYDASFSNVTLKVWEGGSFGNPGTEVYSKNITSEINIKNWTTHILTTPIPLISNNEYWIGYSVTHSGGGFPAGCDAGPAVQGKGDWIYAGGWTELYLIDPGLNFNWNIRGVLGVTSKWIVVEPTSDTVEPGTSSQVSVTLDAAGLDYGTLKFANLIFTPYPDVGEQIINVFLTVPSHNYGYISGNVALEQGPYSTGNIRDVLITAGSDTTHPDITGFYKMYASEGQYDVTASLYGYEDVTQESVTVVAGEETTDIDFDLNCLFGGLSGYVTDFDTGDPVKNAKVTVLGSGLFDMTDENGFYEIVGNIIEGECTVEIRHRDYWPNTIHIEIVQDICNTLNAALQPSTDLYPPRNLEASDTLYDGIMINWSAPGTPTLIELSQHDGSPMYAYYQDFWHGYGVVFDLEAYPYATLEEIDFRHSPWGLTGTWQYKIHIVDWETFTEIASTGYLNTTGNNHWELGIPLGSIHSTSGLVGVLIEPRGNEPDDAYPCLDWDRSLDGYSVIAPLTDFSQYSVADGDFLIDLWIMTPAKEKSVPAKRVKIEDITNHRARKEVNSSIESGEFITINQSKSIQNCNRGFLGMYNLYKSSTPGIPYEELIAEEITDIFYFDTDVNIDEVWYYAATALYEPENPEDPYDESPFSNIDPGKRLGIGVGDGPVILYTRLNPCFPNPFNPDKGGTTISFSLKDRTYVTLSVYNIKGQLVATLLDDEMNPGTDYQVIWDGKSGNRNLGNGIYFYKLETKDKTFIKKMILMR
jgi:hypothetical protein